MTQKDPNNFYVDTRQSELTVRLAGAITGIVFIAVGLYQIFSSAK